MDGFLGHRDFARICRAIDMLDARWREQPRMEAVAREVGLTPPEFSRLFRRWAGISPKRYAEVLTARAARVALADSGHAVLDVAADLGLSGPARLHDLTLSLEAATPGELRRGGAGLEIVYGSGTSPFGDAWAASTPRGLCHLGFESREQAARVEGRLRRDWPRARLLRDDRAVAPLLRRCFAAADRDPALVLHVAGTQFQVQVWRALLELGARRSVTYAELARAIGRPRSCRAVGNAVGANPIGWLIPCHHVLRSNGALGGYEWGVERKRAMLHWESLAAPATRMARA